MSVRVSSKGWVVIPAELRRKYGIKPKSEVMVVDYGGVLALVPLKEKPVEQGAGILSGDPSLTEALVEEHRKELDRGR